MQRFRGLLLVYDGEVEEVHARQSPPPPRVGRKSQSAAATAAIAPITICIGHNGDGGVEEGERERQEHEEGHSVIVP